MKLRPVSRENTLWIDCLGGRFLTTTETLKMFNTWNSLPTVHQEHNGSGLFPRPLSHQAKGYIVVLLRVQEGFVLGMVVNVDLRNGRRTHRCGHARCTTLVEVAALSSRSAIKKLIAVLLFAGQTAQVISEHNPITTR